MSYDGQREKSFYATVDETSKGPYAVQCSSGTLAYADLPPGEYACFSLTAAAGEHFRWAYLLAPDAPSALPTLANAAAFPAPTAATSAQVPLTLTLPAGVKAAGGAGMAPATASYIRLTVRQGMRIVILYSAAGPVTLYCTRIY